MKFVVLVFVLFFPRGDGQLWTFNGNNGPQSWPTLFPSCNGKRQSPINIAMSTLTYEPGLRDSLDFGHYTCPCGGKYELENTGITLKLDVSDAFGSLTLNKTQRFMLDHLHFHWGSNNTKGSEHRFDGISSAAELHFVHYNIKYPTLTIAASKKDGLAVLGVLIKVGKPSKAFNKLVHFMKRVREFGNDVDIKPFSMKSLLPRNTRDFCRYHGSLTTPPCSSNVIWSVFHEHITISQKQLNALRMLQNRFGQPISNNFRPVQNLNGRLVKSSFLGFVQSKV